MAARESKLNILLILFTLWFAAFGTVMVARSIHWPLVHDSPILLYMVFLSEHGMRLYRDIVEVQFPGSLLLYSFERHIFGTSALAFRVFDLCGLGVALASMLVITRRRGFWFASVYGFAFFLLIHTGSWTSIMDLGQRDFFMTCLLGVAVACLIESLRRQQPVLMSGFGISVALASGIKPTAIVFLLLTALIVIELRKQRMPIRSYMGYIVAGGTVGCGIVLSYLLYKQALGAFLHLEWRVVPLYSAIASKSNLEMIRLLNTPGHLFPVLAIGALLLVALRSELWSSMEQQVLLFSAVLGAASFVLQHKGFFYHRLPFIFFFFLWAGWVFVAAIREEKAPYVWVAIALIGLSAIYYPHLMQSAHWDNWSETTLQNDLVRLHAFDKPGDVQCIDTTRGCITVALRTQMIMATGYVSDPLFFLNSQDPRLNELREEFLIRLTKANPRFVVLTNEQWPTLDSYGYDKLKYWPQFQNFLSQNYTMSIEQGGDQAHTRGYRIYIRNE